MRPTQTVERVARVLVALAGSDEGLRVGDLAKGLEVHPSTASRLLGTLAHHGVVQRDPRTGRYRLGPALLAPVGDLRRLPIVSHARPHLEALTRSTGETSNLAVLDDLEVVYVDQVTPPQVLMASWVGRRSPIHASSSGKVLLAYGVPDLLRTVLAQPLRRLTGKTITDPGRLRAVIEEVRRNGYAVSVGELEEGLVTIAAPVIVGNRAIAAVSCSGPIFRLPPWERPRLARMVMQAARGVEHRLVRGAD